MNGLGYICVVLYADETYNLNDIRLIFGSNKTRIILHWCLSNIICPRL